MSKRNELSIDDLLRLQEERAAKRHRSSSDGDDIADAAIECSFDSEEDISDGEGSQSSEESSLRVGNDGDGVGEDQFDRQNSRFFRKAQSRSRELVQSLKSPSRSVQSFSEMGVSPVLEAALRRMSIHTPTEVQAACIPPLLSGRDCIGIAKTGSGKTIAFAIPILHKLSVDPYGIFALILTPSRELAFQISEQFAVLGAAIGVRTSVIVGGMDMITQALELDTRPHVVVATPGRIVDHLKSSSGDWDLSRVKFLVLDEADRLLALSFAPELAYLFQILPADRQTCLFTATVTPAVETLASSPPKSGKAKPFFHNTRSTVETVDSLKQYYLLIPSHIREVYLFHLLCNPPESTRPLRRAVPEPVGKPAKAKRVRKTKVLQKGDEELLQPPPTIIFCTKPRTVAYLVNMLKTLGIRSTGLHSRLTQRERLSSLSLFKAAVIPVLVSTDVGARGLDIEDVAMVVQWDLPDEAEQYTHRVGRTARAGKGGVAISFMTERDESRLSRIEDRIGIKLAAISLPEDQVLEKLNTVSTAKRLANMELHDSNFGQREAVYKLKGQRRP